MRYLILFGSPHPNGNTAVLLETFKKRLEENIDYAFFDSYAIAAQPCIGCGYCENHGTCCFRDLDALYSEIETSDGIIIASPVFYGSFPAPLKAIFDRFQPYYNLIRKKKPLPIEKKGFLLLTGGSANPRYSEMVIPQAKLIFRTLGAAYTGEFFALGCDEKPLTPEI